LRRSTTAIVDAINQTIGSQTKLSRDDEHISLRMRYYAFNSRRYCPRSARAIIEMAYLSNATGRQCLIGDHQRLADSIQAFLATTP
jgi:hypothetical protein